MLIDTNVWSELARRRPDEHVVRWIGANFGRCILSTIVQAEIQYGIALSEDESASRDLQTFHDDLVFRIGDRLLSFDTAAAVAWGHLRADLKRSGKLIGERDMLIAAHAIALNAPVVTRNVVEMGRTGAIIINPWTE